MNKELLQAGAKIGMCAEYQGKLQNPAGLQELAEMYFAGMDFCMSNDFPSLGFLRENVGGDGAKYGIFIDSEIIAGNPRRAVALGDSSGTVAFRDYSVGEVFVRHNASLVIGASDYAFAVVDMYDGSIVSVVASDNARVLVNRYGGTLVQSTKDRAHVKVIEKQKK